MRDILIVLLFGIFIVAAMLLISHEPGVYDFDSCVAAGNSILESYPRQCVHDGETFVEELDRGFNPPE